MNGRAVFAIFSLSLSLIACSGNKQNVAQNPQPTASLANETGLPLPENATIIDARAVHETIDPSQSSGSALAEAGKGTYNGHEVVASADASQQDLETWLASVPVPEGMKKTDPGAKIMAHRYGIDYIAFVSPNGKGATVVVMDPKIVTGKLGAIVSMLDKYNSLPEPMRQAMDSQIKQRTGFSIAELTDKSAPVGAAINAVKEFRNSDKRAIILVSGEKAQ